MALTPPKLDDRTYREIVEEAMSRLPTHINGWQNPVPSDPGVTLIELFAWMTEIILYRQNQIPDWLTVKMMQLFGMTLDEPRAAKTGVTFQLSAPVSQETTIPTGTEIATTQTESKPSIIFSTDAPLHLYPALLKQCRLIRQGNQTPVSELDIKHVQEQQQAITLFSNAPHPHPRDAICFGFDADLSHHLLHFFFECDPKSGTSGIDTTRPPYIWEGASFDESGDLIWELCPLEQDETMGLLQPGRMMVHVGQLQLTALGDSGEKRYWVRLRVIDEGEFYEVPVLSFKQSPRVHQIRISSMGGTVSASHAEIIEDEFLGYSNGLPGQRFWLQNSPILRPNSKKEETLIVKMPNGEEKEDVWEWVADFGDKKVDERAQINGSDIQSYGQLSKRKIFTLNTADGELRLPPAQTNKGGMVQQFGAIPPRESSLWFKRYRHGGGVVGNVLAYTLNTLKTAVPFVNRVYNIHDATGGQDAEPLSLAKLRAPQLLHAQNRAVTSADFEYLASRATNTAIGRVKCLQHEPGWVESVAPGTVYLFVLPQVDNPAGQLRPHQLQMPHADKQKIKSTLDEHRLLTTRLHVDEPEIVWAQVRLTCRIVPGAKQKEVERTIGERLHKYLNPLVGGTDEQGWPFGQDVYPYDVYTCLQAIPDVLAFPEITLYRALPDGPEPAEKERLPIPAHGVVALASFVVKFMV